jgi:hypothetical protein
MQMEETPMGGSLQIIISRYPQEEGRYRILVLEEAFEAAMVFPRHSIKLSWARQPWHLWVCALILTKCMGGALESSSCDKITSLNIERVTAQMDFRGALLIYPLPRHIHTNTLRMHCIWIFSIDHVAKVEKGV